jgi:hypothetical protein
MDVLGPLATRIGKKAKFVLAKVHNVYQSTSREGQKDRLEQTVFYKFANFYLQHYVSYFHNLIPYIDLYPRSDIILDSPSEMLQKECYCISAGKVISVPQSRMYRGNREVIDEKKDHRISPSTEVASACLVTKPQFTQGGKPASIDVLHICQKLQANINEHLVTLSLAHLMPYFNFILEDSMTLHVPLHHFDLSVEYFDEDDDTQHVVFGQTSEIFRN